jgi:UDP-glucose 4-epimerase
MNKKVVVFGGSGFFGGYVADELTRRNYDVTIADIQKSEYAQSTQTFEFVNILDFESVQNVIKGANIVYNFSAVANLDDAIHDPINTMSVNTMGNLNILEACRSHKSIERFIYSSSAYAVSKEGSFYGLSKQSSEKLVEEYYERYGLNFTIIRYGSVYGDRPSRNNYIYNLLNDAIQANELRYNGDAEDIREYIHAADAAKLSVDILESTQYENEHLILTGVERLKRIELLSMINEIMGNKLTIKQMSNSNLGHYKSTPYSYHPTTAKKFVNNCYIDLGQGLLECIQNIHNNLNK